MVKSMLIFLIICLSFLGKAQDNWTWAKIAPMPIATANNATTEAFVNGKKYVYSFGGISDSLKIADIHQRVFKYKTNDDEWEEMPNIPDTLGKIASAVSFVKGKLYLIGGAYIREDSTEVFANKTHIFDPATDQFEADGAELPVPVSDHVQSVWKDSLIYVVTGKTDYGNTPDVQIYNPTTDSWNMGTPLPNDEIYLRNGASGYILGDTIFYFGGATDTLNPNVKNYLIKGVIDVNNPYLIDWSHINFNLGTTVFRGACSGYGNTIFWIGGTDEAYSFYPIDTLNDEPIFPNKKTMMINFGDNTQTNSTQTLNNIMDLRGIANLGGGNWIIAGGIDSLQMATNKTFLLHNPTLSSIEKSFNPPSFEVIDKEDHFLIVTENIGNITVYNLAGQELFFSNKHLADLKIMKYRLSHGVLLFIYEDGINLPISVKKVNP